MTEAIPEPPEKTGPGSAQSTLKKLPLEDYLLLLTFWVLGIIVFVQFFSRYVLNSSIAWTEEIARYLLTCVTFLGAATAARKNAHLFVEAGYRYFPRKLGFLFSTLADLTKVLFYGACSYLAVKILPIMSQTWFTTVKLPMALLYSVVLIGFVIMTFHSILLFWKHLKSGYVPGEDDPVLSTSID